MELPGVGVRRLAAHVTELPAGMASSGTRGHILEAALRLFAERAYGGTSIRDIARAAGMQSASLYSHFPSKEHVLAEIVRIGHEEHHRRVRTALLESPSSDPRDQLRACVRAHVAMHAELPMLAVVTNAELYELSESLAAPSFALRREAALLLYQVILRGTELGVFDPPHPWVAAAAIGGMGMRVANWYSPDFELGVDALADVYAGFALRIVRAKEREGERP